MLIEAQSKEFFLNNPDNIHFVPLDPENKLGEYGIISDSSSGSLLLGIYKDNNRAVEVYEEIKKLILGHKKYYLMPKE